jgi:hypothetical protein
MSNSRQRPWAKIISSVALGPFRGSRRRSEAIAEIIARAAVEPHLCALMPAMTRNPSCLISSSHWLPDGSSSVLLGRHGATNPAGRVRCNIAPRAKAYSRMAQQFFDCASQAVGYRRAA